MAEKTLPTLAPVSLTGPCNFERPAVIKDEPTAIWLPLGDVIEAFHRGETGDAELLAKLYADRICFDHAEGTWHIWREQNWTRDVKELAGSLVANDVAAQYLFAAAEMKREGGTEAEVKELYARASSLRYRWKISNVLALAASQPALALAGDEWDADPWLLAVANGVLDLRHSSFEFRQGEPRQYIRTFAPTQWVGLYEPAPRWEKFLQEIFAEDDELIEFVQRLAGYGITGLSTEHVFPVLWGEGRNGKETLLETLAYVLGELATPVQQKVLLQSDRNANDATPHLYALRGKRLC